MKTRIINAVKLGYYLIKAVALLCLDAMGRTTPESQLAGWDDQSV